MSNYNAFGGQAQRRETINQSPMGVRNTIKVGVPSFLPMNSNPRLTAGLVEKGQLEQMGTLHEAKT